MTNTQTKKEKINIEEEFSIFTEKQLEAIKLIVRTGFWGDCSQDFEDKNNYYSYGYFTNMNKGKEFSGLLSGISKKIKSSGINLISMCSDWWGDGSGDMMFFNMDLINEKELESWANTNTLIQKTHITTLNIQNSFILQITCPLPYYENLQTALRRVNIKEDKIEDINENLCLFSITCNNIQDAAFVDNIAKRVLKY